MVKTNLFRNASESESYDAGAVIFREGDLGEKMYVIQESTVELSLGGEVLDVLEPGEMFGEMALIAHKERSTTATAQTACQVVPLDQKHFMFMVHQTPMFALQVMESLADRLRRTTEGHHGPSDGG